MRRTLLLGLSIVAMLAAQEPNPMQRLEGASQAPTVRSPIYHVNVVARTTKAVNYGHRGEPTTVGLEGTVLLPDAEGKARVENKNGAILIKAKFDNLTSPQQRFGARYLTYVLWAITPEGRATSLGEIVTDGDNEGKLKTASELQSFALVVTAEPYYSVTQPSDVVVMENVIGPETSGRIETVDAQYELLRRGSGYTLDVDAAERARSEPRRQVSTKEYESLLAIYEAQNAIQMAQVEGAANHAPEILAKAETRLTDARSIYEREPKSKTVVTLAREAAQTAEDARLVAMRKKAN